ncbi:28S ribosomal protein S15, mitochondrial [Plutella xylostella]|uniref:28S ribosomal protein S15, mitochondrial n=1 Tax=Plutella xylostella TaxID=51655 RepID=UPI0020324615|nr:28S ribosomal protein S15, mitochondrial [Plutella xylostella]
MLRRLTSTLIQTRTLKHKAKINWVRPDYVPAYHPQRSGDLESLPPISEDSLGLDYSLSKEIEDAPESVKKIFSVAHLGRKEYNVLVKNELVERVRRHQYDERTAETRIAKLTATIRSFQDTMEKYPRNIKSKVIVQELIDKRKKLLKFLRQYDYKKFEWLLEKLNIEYKAHPESYHKLTRKESLRKLTELHCEDICNRKLANYQNLLESQQGPFLKDKLEALKFIRSEQMELQVPVTVTEQDIKKVEKQLEEWTIKDEIKQQGKKKKKNIAIGLE